MTYTSKLSLPLSQSSLEEIAREATQLYLHIIEARVCSDYCAKSIKYTALINRVPLWQRHTLEMLIFERVVSLKA